MKSNLSGQTRKRVVAITLVLVILFGGAIGIMKYLEISGWFEKRELEKIRNYIKEEKYIIHAGGNVLKSTGNEISYTNSKERWIIA